MRFPVLVDPNLLVHEVEKSVRSATSRKCRHFFTHLHGLEEYLLPYLDWDTLHVGEALAVWSVSCLESFACSFLNIDTKQLRKASCSCAVAYRS